jgi:FtsZ-binding cell division protein ZapB
MEIIGMSKPTDKTAVELMIERQLEFQRKMEGAYKKFDLPGSFINDSMFHAKTAGDMAGFGGLAANSVSSVLDNYPSPIALAGNWPNSEIITSSLSLIESPMIKAAYDSIQSTFNTINDNMRLLNSLNIASSIAMANTALSELSNNSYEYFETLVDELPELDEENTFLINEIANEAKLTKEKTGLSIYEKLMFILQIIPVILAINSSFADHSESVAFQSFIEFTMIKIEQLVDCSVDYMEENTELHKADIDLQKESNDLDRERNELLRDQNEILKKQCDPIDDQ